MNVVLVPILVLYCLCLGDLDVDRLADCDDAFFGVPFVAAASVRAFSELSEISLELDRMSPSICVKTEAMISDLLLFASAQRKISVWFAYLSRLQCGVCDLQNQVGPSNVQAQQQHQQTVENVVSREHGQYCGRFYGAAVDDARVEAQPGNDPDECEKCKNAIAQFLVVGIFGDFGGLQENVGTIVNDQYQWADAMQVAHPAEGQQQQCDQMMHEHLPKVFALDVAELRNGQRPVEWHRNHVVRPDVTVNRLQSNENLVSYTWWCWIFRGGFLYLMWIAIPALLDIPEPWFVPQHN